MSTPDHHIHDIVGIGIGPFGLGLAALSEPLPEVDAVFLDQRAEFRWHPGMMIEGSTVQVPFLADLVTMADPTSRFSFLQFLKDRGRLYPFYIRESFYPLRAEYDEYCRWVAAQLSSLRWRRTVTSVRLDDGHYVVTAAVHDASGASLGREIHRGRHLILGVGTLPVLPAAVAELDAIPGRPVIHAADYLDHREELVDSGSVTIIGSGQSAAEIYRDLIEDAEERHTRLDWVTRSPRFFPMEYTKLTLEMTSPEYTDHFRSLPTELRGRLGREQRSLYKGISSDLVDDIHDTLYRLSRGGRQLLTTLLTDAELVSAQQSTTTESRGGDYELEFHNAVLDRRFTRRTEAIVAATGYSSQVPDFLAPLAEEIRLDERGRLDVGRDYTVNDAGTIHVLGGEEHTHGVTAPDLGFGPWRASVVLAAVTGGEPYPIERRIAFQTFGIPTAEVGGSDEESILDSGPGAEVSGSCAGVAGADPDPATAVSDPKDADTAVPAEITADETTRKEMSHA